MEAEQERGSREWGMAEEGQLLANRVRIASVLRGPWTTKSPLQDLSFPSQLQATVSKGALADPGSQAAVAVPAPGLHVTHACPCAQLHMATVTWPQQSSHSPSYIHTQSSLYRPCSVLCYLRHGAHGHTKTHAHSLTYKHDILTLPYICTCPYKLYRGVHGSAY